MGNAILNAISLCSGVGMLDEGVRAGLEYLGVASRTVVYAEREAYPVGILATRMEEGTLASAPIWFGDFTKLPAGRFRGVVDAVIAGFPCQDLSIAGRRVGLDGKRSGLFFNVLDVADDCGAWLLVLENVAGIATATATVVDETEGELEERAAARVLGELAERGWNAEWINLSASDVGASHGRARWFCFAWRMGALGQVGLHAGCTEYRQQQEVPACGFGKSSTHLDSMDDAARNEWDRHEGQTRSGRGVREAGDALAHASSVGCQPRQGDNGAKGEVVATTGCQLGVGDRCCDVADPASARCCSRQDASASCANAQPGPRCIESERGCSTVADAYEQGSQGNMRRDRTGQDRREIPHGSIGERRRLFAPGPSSPGWRSILVTHPWLAPAITDEEAESLLRGMADGVASGLDFTNRAARLRGGGMELFRSALQARLSSFFGARDCSTKVMHHD